MQVRIIENEEVAAAGAVLASQDGRTVICVDPRLDDREKYRLIRELLEQ